MSDEEANIPGLRPARDDDAEGLYALIGACFAEYAHEGVVMDRAGIDADLEAWATYLAKGGGQGFVIAAADGTLLASIGYGLAGGVGEVKRLYMRAEMRGQGLADRLLAMVEAMVKGAGGTRMMLWSDSRFTRAHAFYRRHGYVQGTDTRQLHDPSNTTEYYFEKAL